MIADIVRNGERVGVVGSFRLEDDRLCSWLDRVRDLDVTPGQWIALYRPVGWFGRLWRRLLGRHIEKEIGFARVEAINHGSISLGRVSWRPSVSYTGPLTLYLSRWLTDDEKEAAVRAVFDS